MPSEESDRQPVLVCTAGALSGRRQPVGDGGLILGRGGHCDLVVDDPGVSREHARVLMHNDAVWVQDAGSRNGCFVNGRRLVRHKQLAPGDELRIGEHSFTLELVDPFPADASVSTFGASAPQVVVAPPATQTPPAPSGRGPVVVGIIALLVLIAAGLIAWLAVAP